MTNATKTLALIFAGTLALAFVTTWSWTGSSSAAFQNRLLAVDTSAVQEVRIERSDAPPVQLQRTDSGWAVAPSDTTATYPASNEAMAQLFRTLPSLQVSAVATRQPENHPRYGVDSTGARIAMLGSDGAPLGELIVGRSRTQGSQSQGPTSGRRMRGGAGPSITYVRTPDRPDVYSVEQSLRPLVQRDVEGWREKQIWGVEQTEIQRVDFTFPGDSSFTMRRPSRADTTSAVGPSTWVSRGDTLSGPKITPMMRTLSTPQAGGFAEHLQPSDLDSARYAIRIRLYDGTERTLRFYPSSSPDTYLATADNYPYVARLPKRTWDRSILRGRSSLLRGN